MRPLLLILLAVAACALLVVWLRQRTQRLVSRRRLTHGSLSGRAESLSNTTYGVPDDAVARWLFLAGRRGPDAASRFWSTTTALALLGTGIGFALWHSEVLVPVRADLEAIPGRVGHLFVPVVVALPMALPILMAAMPTASVRRARRERVRLVLRDLYPVLELFASLAQAGLAFDAALARVLTTLGPERPFGRELLTFQAEVQSGADRTVCLRRLARRIEVPQVGSFTSALIRAHEVGMSLAAPLRRQADDLRNDLREQSLARAQSLPARLVFPLVICFLPGIFVMSLGPALYGFLAETAGFGSTR